MNDGEVSDFFPILFLNLIKWIKRSFPSIMQKQKGICNYNRPFGQFVKEFEIEIIALRSSVCKGIED